MSNSNNIPITWDNEQDNNLLGSLFPGGMSSINKLNKSQSSADSLFKNSPFGQYWEKNLPNWALPHFGPARVASTSNLKFVDISQSISQSDANFYQKLLGGKIKPYKYHIFYDTADGQKVLNYYNDPNIKPANDEIYVFIELDDGKFDFGKIVRVKLGATVVKDMQFSLSGNYLSEDELATEIIRKINILKAANVVAKDIKNSTDFNRLLARAIDFEYNNKKFDEFSYLLLFINGLEFLELKSVNWLKDISYWLRQRKYEDEKYWNGHLDKGYEPAFLPTSLFNKTKPEKEKIINELISKPLLLIDEFIENNFKEKTVLSDFFKPKLLLFKNELNEILKPFNKELLKAAESVEGIETYLQYCNAFWVGVWNGILEFIAGIVDLIGIIVLVLKQEVGFRITDSLWEKIENLCNFVYYETQKFLNLIFHNILKFIYRIPYIQVNGYKVVKEIGELVPDIITIMISWLKAAKIAEAGSVVIASEEVATKEVLEKLEKEGATKIEEKAVNEAQKNLDDLVDFSKIRASILEKWAAKFEKKFHLHFDGEIKIKIEKGKEVLKAEGGHNHSVIGENIKIRRYLTEPVNDSPFDALIDVRDKNGQWIEKIRKSSMFPKNWDIKRVKEEIALVYDKMVESGIFDKIKDGRSPQFKGLDSSGKFEIKIEFDELGNLTNAYPIIK